MSDLSTRARALAVRAGIDQPVPGLALDISHDVTGLAIYYRANRDLAAKELSRLVFDISVLCAIMGTDIVDVAQATIDQRELTARKPVPGTAAPVPSSKENDGTLRDPATGMPPTNE